MSPVIAWGLVDQMSRESSIYGEREGYCEREIYYIDREGGGAERENPRERGRERGESVEREGEREGGEREGERVGLDVYG